MIIGLVNATDFTLIEIENGSGMRTPGGANPQPLRRSDHSRHLASGRASDAATGHFIERLDRDAHRELVLAAATDHTA